MTFQSREPGLFGFQMKKVTRSHQPMKPRTFAIIVCLLFIRFCVCAAEQITRQKFESGGKSRTYYILVPPSVKPDTKVPLVILLHGSGRNGLSLVEKWKDLAHQEGFIVVGPDASDTSGWRMPEDAPEFIYELAEMLIKRYPIATNRIYLFGHSAGAVMSLNLAMLESKYFAAVAVHAGSWRSENEFTLLDTATRKIPIKITVGDRDSFFSVDSVKKTAEALKSSGFAIEVLILKNHTHWYYDVASEINRDSWEFLKQHALTDERRHVPRTFKTDLNAVASQFNVLRSRAIDLLDRFYASESQLQTSDFVKEKAAVIEIARKQIQFLTDSAKAFREAGAVADATSRMKIATHFQEYFSLLAQAAAMHADSAELLRTRSELLLSDDEVNSVLIKRNELGRKADQLNREAEGLERRAAQLVQ